MDEDLESVIILIVLFIALYFGIKWFKTWKANELNNSIQIYESIVSKVYRAIDQNLNQLIIQRKRTVYIDPYGKENIANWWHTEIPYFVLNYIYPYLTDIEKIYFDVEKNKIFQIIDTAAKSNTLDLSFNDRMTGRNFELFCAQKLEKEGWAVNATKNTGDQGVDLIIEKGGRKIGIQCKKYSKPVGNKAVQEIKAGLKYYGLIEGVVITNNTFTKSAKELANMNSINLLHFMETDRL